MTLDLEELIEGWTTPQGELRARVVQGLRGEDVIQVRLELGVLQLERHAARPDGQRFRGMPSALDFCRHELRVAGSEIPRAVWAEVERELEQLNYRRLAFNHLAEDALRDNQVAAAQRWLESSLRDIEACQARLRLLREHGIEPHGDLALRPTLAFDQARLLTQWRLAEGRFEEAVEQAEDGAAALETLLTELGFEPEWIADDPGLAYLRELARKLRTEYGIAQTLRERLEEALAAEDYETAAELRDALARRDRAPAPRDAETEL
jgi:hypothetical protein